MKYKRKKKPVALILATIIILICVLFGCSGYAEKETAERASESERCEMPPEYGTRDNKLIEGEIIFEYNKEYDFVPLECSLPQDIQVFIYHLSRTYYIDFAFVMALIECESSFDIDAVSSTNDYGLMQINSINKEELLTELGITDLADPYQNIRSGLYILRKLFEKYDDPSMVLMAYNMGENGAAKLWQNGVYETPYSLKIMNRADEIAAEIENSIKK